MMSEMQTPASIDLDVRDNTLGVHKVTVVLDPEMVGIATEPSLVKMSYRWEEGPFEFTWRESCITWHAKDPDTFKQGTTTCVCVEGGFFFRTVSGRPKQNLWTAVWSSPILESEAMAHMTSIF